MEFRLQQVQGGTRRAFLGLGSNLGDRQAYLNAALSSLTEAVAVSGYYESSPLGGPEQPNYLNAVVQLETAASARQLLDLAQSLEGAAKRDRSQRWGPRTLDVDVLIVGSETIDEPDLVVPHPRMWDRAFVLVPLGELAPELLPKDWQKRAQGTVWPFKSSESSARTDLGARGLGK